MGQLFYLPNLAKARKRGNPNWGKKRQPSDKGFTGYGPEQFEHISAPMKCVSAGDFTEAEIVAMEAKYKAKIKRPEEGTR